MQEMTQLLCRSCLDNQQLLPLKPFKTNLFVLMRKCVHNETTT